MSTSGGGAVCVCVKCKVLRVVQTVDSIRKKEPLPFKYGLPLLFPCNTEMYIYIYISFIRKIQ